MLDSRTYADLLRLLVAAGESDLAEDLHRTLIRLGVAPPTLRRALHAMPGRPAERPMASAQ